MFIFHEWWCVAKVSMSSAASTWQHRLTAMVKHDDHAMSWQEHGICCSPWHDQIFFMTRLSCFIRNMKKIMACCSCFPTRELSSWVLSNCIGDTSIYPLSNKSVMINIVTGNNIHKLTLQVLLVLISCSEYAVNWRQFWPKALFGEQNAKFVYIIN